MFITKMSLARRTFLRGIGATLALPMLESMVPAFASAASPIRRAGFIYMPLGAVMQQWTPAGTGPDFEFTPVLKPLEGMRQSLTVYTGLGRPAGGTHANSAATWLTGVSPKKTVAEDVRVGTTIDQIVANQIGGDTPFPSLEVATEDFTGYVGGCDSGYSCTYLNTISWKTPTTPLPMEINPRVLFERMFGRAGTKAQRLARLQEDRSILDSVIDSANRLQSNLNARDKNRLSEYLDNVREIEQRIQRVEKQTNAQAVVPDAPVGVPESFAEHAGLLFDLLAVAWEADITRVFTFMMGREASQRVYLNLGVDEPHHSLSHHQNNPEKMARLVKIQQFYLEQFNTFLGKLQAASDGENSVLDNSLIFYGSGMSDSNEHSPANLPLLVAGRLGGQIRGNRHVKVADTPMSNLMLDVAERFGVSMDAFGTSTGKLSL